MRVKWLLALFLPAFVVFLVSSAHAQTDVAASIYGAFNGSTTGNGVAQSPSNSAGGLFELRHISNPIFGFEATYSFNRADETYASPAGHPPCPTSGCIFTTEGIKANAHEITADWTPSLHFANLRPFGVLGVGLLLNVPTGAPSITVTGTTLPILITGSSSTTVQPVYVYGAGLDWGVLPHLGLRFQYRGNLYKAPNLSSLYTSTNTFTQSSEPMIGVYFRL